MMDALAIAEAYVREGFGTREFFNQTTVHPVGLAVLGVLSLLTCIVNRRYMLLPLLALACVVSQGQRIVIAIVLSCASSTPPDPVAQPLGDWVKPRRIKTVSYTHLTLPTIYSV